MPSTLNRGRIKENLATPGGAVGILTIRAMAFEKGEKLMKLILLYNIGVRRRYKATTFYKCW